MHLSPPSTTAGRARARQWPGAPPVVRSSEHPDGLSELPAALHNRVQRENSIFKFCAEVCRFCQDQRILFSCEAPANSFMWDMPSWGDFFENVPHLCTTLDQCMFGHASFRRSLLVHNLGTFHALDRQCDQAHLHEPSRGASALAYPWALARAIAHAVREQLLRWGVKLPADRLEFLDDMIRACRAYAGIQVRKKVPPLVPEFRTFVKVRGPLPEFSRPFLQEGNKLRASLPLPAYCVSHPPVAAIPAGSKVLRAVFPGGVAGASSDLESLGDVGVFGSPGLAPSVASATEEPPAPVAREYAASSDPAVDSKIHPSEKFASSSDPSVDSKIHPAEKFASSSDPSVDCKMHSAENFAEGWWFSQADQLLSRTSFRF